MMQKRHFWHHYPKKKVLGFPNTFSCYKRFISSSLSLSFSLLLCAMWCGLSR